ncbi:MAG TPA: hypothetical protein VFZ48_01090 [Candidatus Saccharimonadales bacterium]
MQALTTFTYRPGWDRVSDFHFSLNHNLVHMLSRQLKKAGLHKCQALQWLPEASRNVVTDFEVTLRFTPDATAKQAALVADGLRDEVQQLLNTHDVQAEFRVQCFIAVYFAATSKDGSVKSSNDPGHRFDLVN